MLSLSIWQPVGTTSESYHPQSVELDEIDKDYNLPTITPSYHPHPFGLSNDVKSDVAHDSVISDTPLGGKVLEFLMVTNNTYVILPTSTSQPKKVMIPEALMRTSYPYGNSMSVHVKFVTDVVGLGLRQLFGESLPHDGLPKHTHSSNDGSYYVVSASGVSASTHNTSKVV